MDDLRAAAVDFLTIGQYLQPTRKHAAIDRFVTPDEFQAYKRIAEEKGFLLVAASPLTRSSYHAARGLRPAQGRAPSLARRLTSPNRRNHHACLRDHASRRPFGRGDVRAGRATSRTIRNSCRSARRWRSSAASSATARSVLVATMTVGYGMIHESFTTQGASRPRRPHHPGRISRRAVHLPRKSLALPARPARVPARSRSISPMPSARACSNGWWAGCSRSAVERYTSAFEARADVVYGPNERRLSPHSNDRSSFSAARRCAADLAASEIAEQHPLIKFQGLQLEENKQSVKMQYRQFHQDL